MNQWLREEQPLEQDLAPHEEHPVEPPIAGAEISFLTRLKPQCGQVISVSETRIEETNSSKTLPQFWHSNS